MIEETWYILYGGSSSDGCGPGEYVGRTTDLEIAKTHLATCLSNPWSTGYVTVVTDDQIGRLQLTKEEDIWLKKW